MPIIESGHSLELELKDVDTEGRTIVQAFTRYNVKDADGDIGRRGMFTKSWKESKHRVKHLLNHDVEKPVGKIEDLFDDEDYAYYKAKIGTHKLGDDFLEMANSGLITEASYGFRTMRKKDLQDGGRELLEVKHWECSPLTHWGANEFTPIISLTKSLSKEELLQKYEKRHDALEKFCRTATASDETIELLLLEIKQLSQIIINLSSEDSHHNAGTDDPTLPERKEDDELKIRMMLKAIEMRLAG